MISEGAYELSHYLNRHIHFERSEACDSISLAFLMSSLMIVRMRLELCVLRTSDRHIVVQYLLFATTI